MIRPSIEFRMNGRAIRPDQIGNELERALLRQVEEGVLCQVREIRCPTHGKGAHVIVTRHTMASLGFEVTGCCQTLIDDVQRALGRA